VRINLQSALLVLFASSMVAVVACAAAPTQHTSPAGAASSSVSAPAGPVKDCSACAAGACASVAGQNYCAKSVDLPNVAEMEAQLGNIVSLRAVSLDNPNGPCTLVACDCCNDCGGAPMLFRSSLDASFKRGESVFPHAVKPLKDGAPFICDSHKSCEKAKCPLEPGKYNVVGTLRASDMGWDLELLAIEPAAP
jgi:hypothetical protein